MKTIRITLFIIWALLALIACAVPFVANVLFVRICVALLGLFNLYGIISNIRLVKQLNKMDEEAQNGVQLQEE